MLNEQDSNPQPAVEPVITPPAEPELADARPSFIGRTKRVLAFIWRHWIAFTITLVVIAIIITAYLLIPVVSLGKYQMTNIDTPVRIEIGQSAMLKTVGVSAEIVGFTNDVCTHPGGCFGGSGTQAVEYSLAVDNKKYATDKLIPAAGAQYQIVTESTDYTTYAVIKIVKS